MAPERSSMSIPRQVEEAAEMAEQLFNGIQQQDSTPQEEQQVEEQPEQEAAQESVTEEEPDVPHDDDVTELRKFKERYLSLKGKYDAEVPRLHSELKEFKQSVFERLNNYTPPEQEQTPVDDRLAKFREEYGEDFVENLKALFKAEVDPLLKQSIQPMEDKVNSVEDTQYKAAQENFANYIDQKVKGDWRKAWMGEDPKFQEFLQKPDPSGLYTLGELAKIYNDNWEADKLTNLFNLYYQQGEAPKKSNPTKDAMVAPSRSTTHSAPPADEKIIWTKDKIKEFEKSDRMQAYAPEESQRLWQDLLAAPSEGRVR